MNQPVKLSGRPFAIDRYSDLMYPDGIFIKSMGISIIGFYIVNTSGFDVEVGWVRPGYTEDQDWTYVGNTQIEIRNIPNGGATLIRWNADFSFSKVGKKDIAIEFGLTSLKGADHGYDGAVSIKIFVADAYIESDSTIVCEIPEGVMRTEFGARYVIPPSSVLMPNADANRVLVSFPAMPVYETLRAVYIPRPGMDDLLPFNDPLHKIILAIAAVLFAFLAIKEASEQGQITIGAPIPLDGDGNQKADFSDPYNGTIECCKTNDQPNAEIDLAGVGMYTTLALACMFAALKHRDDPWTRGRQKFPANANDPKSTEQVVASYSFPKEISAGGKIETNVEWTYKFQSTGGKSDALQIEESVSSSFFVTRKEVEIDRTTTVSLGIGVVLRLAANDGLPVPHGRFYGFAKFKSPRLGVFTRFFSGVHPISGGLLGDGEFSCHLDLAHIREMTGEDVTGDWFVDLYGQSANGAESGMLPFVAAQFVGGEAILAPNLLSLEPIVCPTSERYVVTVEI